MAHATPVACFGQGAPLAEAASSAQRCASDMDIDRDGDLDRVRWFEVGSGATQQHVLQVFLNQGQPQQAQHVLNVPGSGLLLQDISLIYPGDGVPFAFLVQVRDSAIGRQGAQIYWLKDGRWFKGYQRWLGGCIEDALEEDACSECGVGPISQSEQAIEASGSDARFRLVERITELKWCKIVRTNRMLALQGRQWVEAQQPPPLPPPPEPQAPVQPPAEEEAHDWVMQSRGWVGPKPARPMTAADWVSAAKDHACLGFSTARKVMVCANYSWDSEADLSFTHHDLSVGLSDEDEREVTQSLKAFFLQNHNAFKQDKLVEVEHATFVDGACEIYGASLRVDGDRVLLSKGSGVKSIEGVVPKRHSCTSFTPGRCAFSSDLKAFSVEWQTGYDIVKCGPLEGGDGFIEMQWIGWYGP